MYFISVCRILFSSSFEKACLSVLLARLEQGLCQHLCNNLGCDRTFFFLKKRIRQTLMFLCRHFWDICQTTNIFLVVLIEENKTKNKQANKTCTRHQRTKKTKTKQKQRTFSYFVTACSKYKNWGLKRILNKKEKKHNVNDY